MRNQDKKITVSIGIPAYNEAGNIGILLENLITQKEADFTISEIIVVSDGSTDATIDVVKLVDDARITIVELEKRMGLCNAQNELVSRLLGDIVVLLDADILPLNDNFINGLVEPILKERQNGVSEGMQPIGIVSGDFECAPPKTFIEKVLVESFNMKRDAMKQYNAGDNLYMCVGCARAFSRELINKLRWEDAYGEDAYSYLFCKQEGFRFLYTNKSRSLFRVPSLYNDHLRQSFRHRDAQSHLKEYFPEKIVEKEFLLPKMKLAKSFLLHTLKHPILNLVYLGIFVRIKLIKNVPTAPLNLPHEEVKSTKLLVDEVPDQVLEKTKNKLTVTIGVPALNEEKNIGKLLDALLVQKSETYSLDKIIVVSDGSTDGTNNIVASYKDQGVELIALQKQSGVAHAQNVIAREATSDVLVLVDADILPDDERVLEELVKPFLVNSNTSLVSGPALPIQPKTFFEKIIAVSEECKTEAFGKTRNGQNIFCCRGRVCALGRDFYQAITWPDKHADDSYSYLFCKQRRGIFTYTPKAIVRFRAPQNYKDHKKQSIRYIRGRFTNDDFPEMDVMKEYELDIPIFVTISGKYFFRHPFLFLSYLIVLAVVRFEAMLHKLQKDSSVWTPIESSKDV